jgi:hypothetical protein
VEAEEAIQYGTLIMKYNKSFVNISRIRLFDGHKYNWHDGIIRDGELVYHTDQTHDLGANPSVSKLKDYKEVWLDGVLLYKRPWWRVVLW